MPLPEPALEAAARRRLADSALARKLLALFPPGQFVRYLCVGCFNTAFGYTTFAVINFILRRNRVPASYIFAVAISNLINISVAYFGYKLFVFRTKGNYFREWAGAMAVGWSGFLPAVVLLPLLVRLFVHVLPLESTFFGHAMSNRELAPYVANALLTGVAVIYTFIGHKKVTFRRREQPD